VYASFRTGFLNLWTIAHEIIFDGPRPCIIEIEYVLQDEPLITNMGCLWANRLCFRIDCSARCGIEWFYSFLFLLCTWATVVALEKFYVCGPRTLCLFINWATCLKMLRTPGLGYSKLNIDSHYNQICYCGSIKTELHVFECPSTYASPRMLISNVSKILVD